MADLPNYNSSRFLQVPVVVIIKDALCGKSKRKVTTLRNVSNAVKTDQTAVRTGDNLYRKNALIFESYRISGMDS